MGFQLNNLVLSYDQQPVVQGVTGTFASKSSTAIVGPNGAGKSTLLKTLVGMHTPDCGDYSCPFCREEISYLPQKSSIDDSFPISVMDTVLLGFWREAGLFKRITPEQFRAAKNTLCDVGLAELENRPIARLSAGQLQRVFFARIQLQNAPVILLDEPFTGIDLKTVKDLMEFIQYWQKEQRTVIAALHDLDQVRQYFPNTLLLAKECIEWGRTEDVLSQENLQKAWNASLNWGDEALLV